MNHPGDFSQEKEKSAEIQAMVELLKPKVALKTKKSLKIYSVESYIQQAVAGMNYVFKIKVGENDYIHVHAFRSVPDGEWELQEVEEGKTANEPLQK